MRRQKRDMNERANQRGYQAGSSGRPKDGCPHADGILRQHWMTGWREGRCDNWDALTGVSGLQNAFHRATR
ncbi:ribosome modulation factor [Sinobacterium caligoides]|uniref:Ribosome modulation factor n=1 Tax=Sinobacterium caligoides TaxID=933926 RepID=A0A3N2DZ11_9GAMM|nr:ribosome modulation factor [Sinobacterium caligoides]ROS04997.1 ribosome modulation factor [Sinobacterium caligoides]